MYFSVNWVRRIKGFQQHGPNQSSVKSSPRRSFFVIHNDNSPKNGIKFRYSSILNWILFFKRLNFLKYIDTLELGSTEDRPKYGMELTNKTSFKISCELTINILYVVAINANLFLKFLSLLFLYCLWLFYIDIKLACLNLAKDFSSRVFNLGIFHNHLEKRENKYPKGKWLWRCPEMSRNAGGYRVWQIYIHLVLTRSHVALENEGWKQLHLGLVDMFMAKLKCNLVSCNLLADYHRTFEWKFDRRQISKDRRVKQNIHHGHRWITT